MPEPAPAPAPAPPVGVAAAVASAPSQPAPATTAGAQVQTPTMSIEPATRLVTAAPAPPADSTPVMEGWLLEMLWQAPKRSETIANLAKALSVAQGQILGAQKDSKNPHFRSAYSSLGAIWNACRDALSKNGLAVLQPVTASGKHMVITTILTHESGEWIEQPLMLTSQQNTPQAIGSTITYGRRYALAAMVGVAPEDDDGEAASRTLPGAVVQDSRSTPLQQPATTQERPLPPPVPNLTPLVSADASNANVPAAVPTGTSAVPPPPGRPPARAPGSK